MRSDARKRLPNTPTTKDQDMDQTVTIATEVTRTSRGLTLLEEALLLRLEQTTASLTDYAEECERLRNKARHEALSCCHRPGGMGVDTTRCERCKTEAWRVVEAVQERATCKVGPNIEQGND